MKRSKLNTKHLAGNIKTNKLKYRKIILTLALILFVFTSAYLIVRFSQAGRTARLTVSNSGLKGGDGTINGSIAVPAYPGRIKKATPSKPVGANFGSIREPSMAMRSVSAVAGKKICAYVGGSNANKSQPISWSISLDNFSEKSSDTKRSLSQLYGTINFKAWPANIIKAGTQTAIGSVANSYDTKCITVSNPAAKTKYDRPYYTKVLVRPTAGYSNTSKFGVAEVWVE